MSKPPVKNSQDLSFILPAHIRAARAWLGWTLDDAEAKSGISRDSISRFELDKKNFGAKSREKIFATFLAAGIELRPDGLRVIET
jgi:hypothetical protein